MKSKVIETMMHDDKFNPTAWALDAIRIYASNNVHVLIPDPISREYLFKGMEEHDAWKIADNVVKMYAEQDRETFEAVSTEFVQAMIDQRINNWSLNRSFDRIFNKSSNTFKTKLIKQLLEMKPCSTTIDNKLPYMESDDIKKMLENWASSDWSQSDFEAIINRFSDEHLFEVKDLILTRLDRYGFSHYARTAQRCLGWMTDRIPDSKAKEWYEWLTDLKFYSLYLNYDVREELRASASTMGLSEYQCICGRYSSTKSGYKNHRNACISGPSVLLQAKMKMAKNDPNSLICSDCGIECKTKSGLTLHRKTHKKHDD